MSTSVVRSRLEAARKNLLDTTLRNKLINYRTPKARGVDVVGEDPVEIYRILVQEGKKMTFAGQPDDVGDDDINRQEMIVDPTDLILNTNETQKNLLRRLLKTWRDAEMSMEEQGVNILFLALGMLEWFESDSSQDQLKAPLILIPVLIERSRGNRFTIEYEDTEVGENLSLAAKLRDDFRITFPPLPDSDDLNVRKFFSDVSDSIHSQQRWRVNDKAVSLGFFSYSKYLLYKDLEGTSWPENRKPWNHSVLESLLQDGLIDQDSSDWDEDDLDRFRPVGKVHEVCDADGSQVLALIEADSGRSMIIEGPPGTGKSQTITNLIAEAVGAGKTILFVAEKRAALEIVRRNLEKASLGEIVLELHSHKTNKKLFYDTLHKTMELGQPRTESIKNELNKLASARDRLSAYCHALHRQIETRQISPYEAIGHLVSLGPDNIEIQKPPFTIMNGWTEETFRQHLDLVFRIERKVRDIGVPAQNIFFDSELDLLLPDDEISIASLVRRVRDSLLALVTITGTLSERIGCPAPTCSAETVLVLNAAKCAADAPGLEGIAVSDAAWDSEASLLITTIRDGARLSELHRLYDSTVKPDAWSQDVSTLLSTISRHGNRWYRFVIRSYWKARSHLKQLCGGDIPSSYDDRVALLGSILESQRLTSAIDDTALIFERIFGKYWQRYGSDWSFLENATTFITNVRAQVADGAIPATILTLLERAYDRSELTSLIQGTEQSITTVTNGLASSLDALNAGPALRTIHAWQYTEQLARLNAWLTGFAPLRDLVSYNQLAREAASSGIIDVARSATHWSDASGHLAEGFQKAWYAGIMHEACEQRPEIARFDRGDHESAVNVFKTLDEMTLKYNRTKVAMAHWSKVPRYNLPGGVGLLQHEFSKKRRHMPIRQIMSKAGDAIQAIKPVFMMSPISTAMYLPPGGPTFDMTIFDEASQIKPEDAFSPIIRSTQSIIVGDSKQLPPTSFFDRLTVGDDNDDDLDELNVTRDLDSILALMSSKVPPSSRSRRYLRWHYRSRHDSLIYPSNALFYDGRLVIFPTAERKSKDMGLFFNHHPNTVYGRGGSKKNLEEAKLVVKAILRHAEMYPNLSLGVAAFSISQQEAIYDELELARRNWPELSDYENRHTVEPLFVKNLETVQGDERDVIIISVGYGRDADGFIAMNFGPLNKDGGERRLNVLITRARIRCEVFSNIRADDIRLSESPGAGVAAFKSFLHYAETGQLDIPIRTNKPPMSPFEEAVISKIQAHGYRVEPQVGSAGFFIDIGVCDPANHDHYVLGIECDGAKYHSASCTRDRDRLRQMVLEDRGWRIHRIWGTDWWRNEDREMRRVIEAIQQAIAACGIQSCQVDSGENVPGEPAHTGDVSRHVSQANSPGSLSSKYEVCTIHIPAQCVDLWDVNPSKMASLVATVVDVESPVHFDEVVRRLREAAGLERAGNRIRQAIRNGVNHAKRAGTIMVNNDFLWKTPLHTPEIRDRSEFPNNLKKLELIAAAEIREALLAVVKHSYGIGRNDAIVAALQLLGFERVTEVMKSSVDADLSELISSELIRVDGDALKTCGDE